MFFRPPLSGLDPQGRMQIRLSARSTGTLESPRSGGGSDSELDPCADVTDEPRQKKSLLAGIYPDSTTTGSAD